MISFVWICLVILQCVPVAPRSTHSLHDSYRDVSPQYDYSAQNIPKYEEPTNLHNEQVISVRITSSVAVGKRKRKPVQKNLDENSDHTFDEFDIRTEFTKIGNTTETITSDEDLEKEVSNLPPNLIGANIEFIKQLSAKKKLKNTYNSDQGHNLQLNSHSEHETKPVLEFDKHLYDESADMLPVSTNLENINEDVLFKLTNKSDSFAATTAEPSLTSVVGFGDENYDDIEDVPLARSVSQSRFKEERAGDKILFPDQPLIEQDNVTDDSLAESSIKSVLEVSSRTNEGIQSAPVGISLSSPEKYIQQENSTSQTTISFNIVYDAPVQTINYEEPTKKFVNLDDSSKFYSSPKVYSQPAKVYSEPAKFYSEPAKVYSEPAKIYSEPAKIYSEPAKIYSEPAKFYSPPASLHLPPDVPPNYTTWQQPSHSPPITTNDNTTPITTIAGPEILSNAKAVSEHQPERNYEVDEKISVMSDGRIHGVQESSTEKCKQDNCKVGYVVEGRQYKKYRVEERTSDGFIVGEYGVVRNEDGALRGVRYTADSDASPRLIYDALMKFLQLK